MIPRPRLVHRLHEGLHVALTCISALPGYGKTTLLSEWATATDVPVAWVSLNQDDNDRIRFWTRSMAAIKQIYPAFDVPFIPPADTGGPSDVSLIAALINGLNDVPEPIALVWDDFHVVGERAILDGITYLLEYLPPHSHLYIASRTMPPFPMARIRARGNLHVLETADLRFSQAEASGYFGCYRELQLSKREIDDIVEQTEGWIAGMRMAAEQLCDPLSGSRWNAEQNAINRHDYADDYFEKILSKQPETLQRWLLLTSTLERMNAGLCAALTGMTNSSAWLEQLEHRSLFLVSLDDRQEWYRYHRLFGQFLRRQLQTREPEQIPTLHAAAGQWLEANHFTHEAVDQYLAGEMYEEALRLMENLAPQMMQTSWNTMRGWVAAIPVPLLRGKPLSLMMKTASLLLSGQSHGARQMLDEAKAHLPEALADLSEPTAGQVRAGVYALEAFYALCSKNFEASLRFSEQYVQLHPDGDLFVGFGMDEDGDQSMWDVYAAMGSLRMAEQVLRAYLRIWSGTKNGFFVTHLHLSYAKLLYEQNRLLEAEQSLQSATELGKTYNHPNMTVISMLWTARVYTAQGRFEEAEYIMQSLIGRMDSEWSSLLSRTIEWFQVLLGRMRGKGNEKESDWLQTCGLSHEDEIPPSMLDEYDLFTCLLAERGRTEEALQLAERLLCIADREDRRHDKLRLLVRKSLILAQHDAGVSSLDGLEEALEHAGREEYIRTFADEGKPLFQLLSRYVHARQRRRYRGQGNVPLYHVKRLLYVIAPSEEITVDEDIRALTQQEMNVLRLMNEGWGNKDIASKLGIAPSTLKTHIHHLYRKLGTRNRMLALQRAKQRDLL